MAVETLIETDGNEFFQMNARYSINPSSTAGELFNDFDCLAGSGMAVLSDVASEAGPGVGEKIFAAYYLLQQAIAAHSKAHKMLFRAGALDS